MRSRLPFCLPLADTTTGYYVADDFSSTDYLETKLAEDLHHKSVYCTHA